jgi:lipopolysaccharide transport system ATP-binding protein
MYVRLAFAVAAHLEPEILVIDEVLAVGDAQFQKKCLGKIGEVGRSGRTVLFVSHNMIAVRALCSRCCCLDGGRLVEDAEPDAAIRRYLIQTTDAAAARQDLQIHPRRSPGSQRVMTEVRLADSRGEEAASIAMGGGLSVHVRISSHPQPVCPVLGVVVKDRYGAALFGINNRVVPGFRFGHPVHDGRISCHYDSLPLMPGTYTLDLYLGNDSGDLDIIHDAISFEVLPDDLFGSGKLPPTSAGSFCVPARWTLETASAAAN